jgi:signal transduction histidine kinase
MTNELCNDSPSIKPLICYGEAIPPDTLVSALSERFYDEPDLDALPIVKGGYPYGLATRRKILTTLAIRFGFALYGKKMISVIADMDPLIVHIDESLDRVLSQAMTRNFNDIYDEILVVDEADKYVGRLSVKKLVIEQGNHLAKNIALRELAVSKAAEIEKMNKLKTSFMAHVTHELRSPVSAIVGFAELMQLHFAEQNLEDFPKFLSLLSSNSQNLRAIINNILDIAKIEAGRMELHLEEFTLDDLLSEVLETSKILVGDKPVKIDIDCPETSATLYCDRVKVRQILLNLTSNAVKYSNRGIIVIAANLSEQLNLSVKDTGIGIRKEHLARIFDAFDQLEETKTRCLEGTGLGLTITRQMVHLLGGAISVESTFGVGSRFDVTLPCRIKKQNRKAN